jgi:hypothetical protein
LADQSRSSPRSRPIADTARGAFGRERFVPVAAEEDFLAGGVGEAGVGDAGLTAQRRSLDNYKEELQASTARLSRICPKVLAAPIVVAWVRRYQPEELRRSSERHVTYATSNPKFVS